MSIIELNVYKYRVNNQVMYFRSNHIHINLLVILLIWASVRIFFYRSQLFGVDLKTQPKHLTPAYKRNKKKKKFWTHRINLLKTFVKQKYDIGDNIKEVFTLRNNNKVVCMIHYNFYRKTSTFSFERKINVLFSFYFVLRNCLMPL